MSGYQSLLRITEIFYSLQGESVTTGLPTVFIRLTGCPLRCQYCDTEYAFHGGAKKDITEILECVAAYPTKYVCVTGGEPLAQKGCIDLLAALCDRGYRVSLETSGALDITSVDPRVSIVMDIKTPGSKMVEHNRLENIPYLKPIDQVKFVLSDRDDYEWACRIVKDYDLLHKAHVLFSPSYEELDIRTLGDWIVADRIQVRLQCQLHKILWGNQSGV